MQKAFFRLSMCLNANKLGILSSLHPALESGWRAMRSEGKIHGVGISEPLSPPDPPPSCEIMFFIQALTLALMK